MLAERGIYVRELTEIRPTLESFFLNLTGRQTDRATGEAESGHATDEEEAT